jgi:hypothetical protein
MVRWPLRAEPLVVVAVGRLLVRWDLDARLVLARHRPGWTDGAAALAGWHLRSCSLDRLAVG